MTTPIPEPTIYQEIFKEAVENVINKIRTANNLLIESGDATATGIERFEAMISSIRDAQAALGPESIEALIKGVLEDFVSDSIIQVLQELAVESLVKNLGGLVIKVDPKDGPQDVSEGLDLGVNLEDRFSVN